MNINVVMRKNGLRSLEMQRPQLSYFKSHPEAPSLRFATQGSACFANNQTPGHREQIVLLYGSQAIR